MACCIGFSSFKLDVVLHVLGATLIRDHIPIQLVMPNVKSEAALVDASAFGPISPTGSLP